MRKLALLVVLALPVMQTHAADQQGQFSVRGVGLLQCQNFTTQYQKAGPEYQMIGGWLDGFITGANASLAGTYEVMSYESTELLAEVIRNHCIDNPDHRLFEVVSSIVRQKIPQRLQAASPLRRVQVGEFETFLHAETVQRMQRALAEDGYLQPDEVNGEFTLATQHAVRDFQAAKSFSGTGFPDQATLWLLFDS